MRVDKGAEKFTIELPLEEHWKVIRLPIFPAPAAIDQRPYDSGITQDAFHQIELAEKAEDVAKRLNVDAVLFPDYPPETFARFVAKVAYGYAVARYSLSAFEEVYIGQSILGEVNDIGRWVGCSNIREFPARDGITVSAGFKITPQREVIAKVKLFAQFDGIEYVVIVGKLKEICAVSFGDRGWPSR